MRARRPSRRTKAEQVSGIISIHPNGFGFLRIDSAPGEKEIFIPASKMGSALPGDRVLVRLRHRWRGRRNREGVVVKILERKLTEVIGFFNGTYVVPRDERIPYWFLVSPKNSKNAKVGEMVRAEILCYPSSSGQAEAKIIEVLGRELNAQLESKLILSQFGFKEEFPEAVKRDLERILEPAPKKELKDRVDLTHLPLITIDPEEAKDFDDAVAVKKTSSGFKLWVAIADVSYYVPSETELDYEAYKRATSVYFPDRAIPMLPEPISSGSASLMPNQDRLAMVVETELDQRGRILRSRFYPAHIRTRFRMNYTEVQKIFDQTEPELRRKYQAREGNLWEMAELAKLLIERRRERGALDFDLPEAKVELDEKGEAKDIYPAPKFFSHRLIEEFMLVANQAVAEFLFRQKLLFPYRIHEPPEMEKILELDHFLKTLGVPLLKKGQSPSQIHPRDFQKVFDLVADKPSSNLVSYLILRSMMQAKYSPENKGHFGLALSHYCHFTSPIRRYPDLITHRVLKQALGILSPKKLVAPEPLSQACEHCSERERASIDAEREMVKFYQARLLSKHLGEEFKGIISGLAEFGVFVELQKPMAEGLIPESQLPGYVLNEENHTAFVKFPRLKLRLGDRVLVEVCGVNLERREVDFRLIGILESEPRAR